MMTTPLLSVIVVTYNHEATIAETIDSILAQNVNFDIEILVGEDCSTDETLTICKSYGDKIKLITTTNNVGMMPNFIRCLNATKGKYIALCDGDDYWTNELKLQKQVSFLEENESFGICFHEVIIYDEALKEFKKDNITSSKKNILDINDLAAKNFMHTPSVVLRNDFELPNWFVNLPMGDWSLYLLQLGNRKVKKFTDEMAVYRVHHNGVWSTKTEMFRITETIRAINLLLKSDKIPVSAKSVLQLNAKKLERHLKNQQPSLYKKIKLFFRKK